MNRYESIYSMYEGHYFMCEAIYFMYDVINSAYGTTKLIYEVIKLKCVVFRINHIAKSHYCGAISMSCITFCLHDDSKWLCFLSK